MKTFEDNNIMSFGKHRGQKLEDIPDSYIIWMCNEGDILKKVKDDTEDGAIARYFKLAYDSFKKK